MKTALLDTNVLLALAWPNHQHHGAAHAWFAAHSKKDWATCAATQLGFIRLSSNPAYTANAVSPGDAATLLQQWTRLKKHRFWPSPAADDPDLFAHSVGHQQVNDAWLVAAAIHNAGYLATFDTRLTIHAIEPARVFIIPG